MTPKSLFIALSLLLLLLPNQAAAQTGPYNDAYTYSDSFTDNGGVDLAATTGLTNFGGYLGATATNATAVSGVFTLQQPSGGTFTRWTFADVELGQLNNVSANTLEVLSSTGQVLLTRNNLTSGFNSIDLTGVPATNVSLKLRWTVTHTGTPGVGGVAGARLLSWRAVGESEGITQFSITPAAATVNSGSTINFNISIASNGAVSKAPVVRFSLTDINGLDALGNAVAPDDGLAQDAEADYGSGIRKYRPLTLVSAANAPAGEQAVGPAAGAVSGELVWTLADLPSGFNGTIPVTLQVPKGYINGKTIAARARLEHGLAPAAAVTGVSGRSTRTQTSVTVPVVSVQGFTQYRTSTPANVLPGATGIVQQVGFYNPLEGSANAGDAEEVTVTLQAYHGTAAPIFKALSTTTYGSATDYPVEITSQPNAVNAAITSPIVINFHRISYASYTSRASLTFDIPSAATNGQTVTTQIQYAGSTPPIAVNSSITTNISILTLRHFSTYYTHRNMTGTEFTGGPWPGPPEYYIDTGSLRAGEYFSSWLPSGQAGSHTVNLDHSYTAVTVPAGVEFLGWSNKGSITRAYKDSTGTAPLPNEAGFDHNAVSPHPAWKPITVRNLIPAEWFTPVPDDDDPNALVGGGGRMLIIKDNDRAGSGHQATAQWRMADGTSGVPEREEGTAFEMIRSHNWTYETFTNPAGALHDAGESAGMTIYKESRSFPKVAAQAAQIAYQAGSSVQIDIVPGNRNLASQYVDGRWVVNFFSMRDQIDLGAVTGQVITEGYSVPEEQEVTGIIFHPPDPVAAAAATSADDPACMAWWEIPTGIQPPNGWGQRLSGVQDADNIVDIYRLRLTAPIKNTVPAGTQLTFVAEARRNDLSARGADNAVSAARHSPSNYTATTSVTVLEAASVIAAASGPSVWPTNSALTFVSTATNNGNAPANGYYLVMRVPANGSGGSQFTPDYLKAYTSQSADDVIVEASVDATAFSAPLSATWTAVTLQATDRSGYLAESTTNLPANTTALRLRRNPASTQGFQINNQSSLALNVFIPDQPALEGLNLYVRALSGTSSTLGGTSNTSLVESADTITQIGSNVSLLVSKSFVVDHTRAGFVKWILQYRNASGSAAENVEVVDTIPDLMFYEGLAAPLTDGQSPEDDGTPLYPNDDGSGGLLRFTIASLAPDDGNPASGDDQGTLEIWTRMNSDVEDGVAIANNLYASVSGGIGATTSHNVSTSQLNPGIWQTFTPERTGDSPSVNGGDIIHYWIEVGNDAPVPQYMRVYDALPEQLDFVPGSLLVNFASAGDHNFSGDVLDFTAPDTTAPGTFIVFQFDARVRPGYPAGTVITNQAVFTPTYNLQNPDAYTTAKATVAATVTYIRDYRVLTTADSGPGSLRDIILHANASPEPKTITFQIPSNMLTDGVAVITPLTPLPAITTPVFIDGTTQSTLGGNTNDITLGSGGTVGTGADGIENSSDEFDLPQLNGPEVEIADTHDINGSGLQIRSSSVTIQGLAIHGFEQDIDLATAEGSPLADILIEGNVLGTSATNFTTAPTSGASSNGILLSAGTDDVSNLIIRRNLIGFVSSSGILIDSGSPTQPTTQSITIEENEIQAAGYRGISFREVLDGIPPSGTFLVQHNLTYGSSEGGIVAGYPQQSGGSPGSLTTTITENTSRNNGGGIGSSNGGFGTEVSHNIIRANLHLGVFLQFDAATYLPPSSFRLTQNSISGSGDKGIFLNGEGGAATDGAVNDGIKSSDQPNHGMDYPVITSVAISDNVITLSGYVGNDPAGSATFADTSVELFAADTAPASAARNGPVLLGDAYNATHGEGRVYLGTLTTNASGLFSGTITPSAAALFAWQDFIGHQLSTADPITATAIDSDGNTSEFGPNWSDFDSDGTQDWADSDADDDGIDNLSEDNGNIDTDSDGYADMLDLDSDNDGIADSYERGGSSGLADTDADFVPDFRDLDSDNDGLNDVREAGGTDSDGNGRHDIATVLTPPDSDDDGAPDFLDLDSDTDTLSDLFESGQPGMLDTDDNGVAEGSDLDGDGIISSVDGDDTIPGDHDDPPPVDTDTPADLIADYLDIDSDNNGINDINDIGHGIWDTDGDGRITSADIPASNATDADHDGVPAVIDMNDAQFGGLTSPYPVNLNAWQFIQRFVGAGDTPHSNLDGDLYDDLLEFALGLAPTNGAPISFRHLAAPAVPQITEQGDGSVNFSFIRPVGLRDLTYNLEVTSSLLDSASWTPSSQSPSILDNNDGTETVLFADVSSHPGTSADLGFTRLAVSHTPSGNSSRTLPIGWSRHSMAGKLQTYAANFLRPTIGSGQISAVDTNTLTLTSPLLDGTLDPAHPTYLEIIDGTEQGHRFDIDLDNSGYITLTIVLTASSNTSTTLPAGLVGARFVLRQHQLLGTLLPVSQFPSGGLSSGTSDQVLIWNGTGYDTYYHLSDGAGTAFWAKVGDNTFTNRDGTIIPPGTGLFAKHYLAGSTTTVRLLGEVRANGLRLSLQHGDNLIATGFPIPLAPQHLQFQRSNGFMGSLSSQTADQINIWRGDDAANTPGYTSYFLAHDGGQNNNEQWIRMGDNQFANQNSSALFGHGRAVFLRRRGTASVQFIPCPWTP
ncbi:MAG: TIGR02597 family protein [Prosthecobacter sp.]|uniref:TIGR02597 family protein n=1 Tax=Prosthecobacter sp. TaxID=1965333 RepID=UPI003902ABE3